MSDLEENGYVELENDPTRGRDFEAQLAEVIGTEEMKQLRISLE